MPRARQKDVLGHGEVAEHLALLGREAHAQARDLEGREPYEVATFERDGAGHRLAHTHDGAERGRLAGTVASDEAYEFARAHLQRHAAQDRAAVDVHHKVGDEQH
jgi:hypothetical protein